MRYDLRYFLDTVNKDPLRFCQQFLPGGRREGQYWICGDKTGIAGRSMAVHLTGRYVGRWFDNATGEHGNFLDLLYFRFGKKTLTELTALLSLPVITNIAPPPTTHQSKYSNGFQRLYNSATNHDKTPIIRYLASRGIHAVPDCLRFNAHTFVNTAGELLKLPALLAPITDNTFRLIGLSKTFLAVDGVGKADLFANKRIAGRLKNGAVRFYPPNADVTDLIVGEGIETVLSVHQALPNVSAAACLSAVNLANFIPPPTTLRLWVAFDNDVAGRSALTALLQQAKNRQFTVLSLPPVLNDHNDDLVCCKNFVPRLQAFFRDRVDSGDH